ncbi:Ecm1 protein [Martiniozyma asiatica (nom. inval.)]|nr:Ecm1 protein [Martiniozyma asiatica]
MVKKGGISKHSRAARRGELDKFESSEAQELAKQPRHESTDVITPMIRSSLDKNQQLLNNKLTSRVEKKKQALEMLKNGVANNATGIKKKNSLISKTIKSKQRKFLSVDGRLGNKIEKSIRRNKIVANLRKTGWEKINELARDSLNDDSITHMDSVKKTTDDVEDELAMEINGEEEEQLVEKPNMFSLLAEEDA